LEFIPHEFRLTNENVDLYFLPFCWLRVRELQRKTKIQNLDFRLLDEIHVWNELQTTISPKSETCPISLFRDCMLFY